MAKKAEATTQLWAVIQSWLDALPYPPSQNKLAERIGVAGTAVSQWKWGQSRPTPENLRALADEMEPVAGPSIYDRLRDAVTEDLGYVVRRGRRAANVIDLRPEAGPNHEAVAKHGTPEPPGEFE